MFVRITSYRSPSSATISSGLGDDENERKKLRSPSKTFHTPVKPMSTSTAAVTPLRAGIPAKSNAFSMWSVSRAHVGMPDVCCAVYEIRYRI